MMWASNAEPIVDTLLGKAQKRYRAEYKFYEFTSAKGAVFVSISKKIVSISIHIQRYE